MAETAEKATEHQFGEAFTLMWYECESKPASDVPGMNTALLKRLEETQRGCGHRERIWNSRNGVTPFGLSCPSCGKPTMRHVNWKGDVYAPDHKPHRWQRYFRDGTDAEMESILSRRFIQMAEHGYPLPAGEERRAIFEEAKQTEFQPGWPMLAINLPEP